ncbi:MAG TPA: glycosyltransferase family 4 protein [Gammaproteobacteria bacterium]|nr:glycosyltransferase family 4 protein [Gammaproteobacteria bacterium]
MLDESTSARRGSRLRVLFVTADKFPPFRPAAKAIFAEGLAASGHDVDWLIQAADERTAAGPRHYKRGVAFIAATNGGSSRSARLRKYWAALRNDWHVFRLLREHDYSLVQIKDKYLGAMMAIVAAKLHRLPVVYWLAYPHGEASAYAAARGVARYAWFYALRGRLQQWLLYRIILPACDHVFVQSEQMRSDIASQGIAPSKMTAVPSSVNLAEIDSAVATGGAASRRQTIAYLGTLLRERRLDVLIRALAHVRERIPDADLVFVGGGENAEDEASLWREAQRLGLGTAVTITGWLPMPQAWELVRTTAVCVSPYYPTAILRSTSPTKLVEYMALGKAVVANAHPEQSDVVERSGCGVVCGWGERAFAEALVAVLSSPLSAEAMGRAGRRFVETERTHTVMVDLVTSTYRDVLERRAAVRSTLSVPFTPPLLSRRSRGERADD